jgi:hypothetical protein
MPLLRWIERPAALHAGQPAGPTHEAPGSPLAASAHHSDAAGAARASEELLGTRLDGPRPVETQSFLLHDVIYHFSTSARGARAGAGPPAAGIAWAAPAGRLIGTVRGPDGGVSRGQIRTRRPRRGTSVASVGSPVTCQPLE